ncbi:MAG: transcription elongation factor GreA [Bradymonadaceae bacterium]
MPQIPMTREGFEQLKEELEHLKKVERPKVVEAIEEARGHGDLSENAEYDAAKEKQGFVEGRIQELESMIAQAQVIDPSELSGDRVKFGATVTIFNLETDEEKTYKIVGKEEADIEDNEISYTSPIANALIGQEVADEVTIDTPSGEKLVEIIEVEFV